MGPRHVRPRRRIRNGARWLSRDRLLPDGRSLLTSDISGAMRILDTVDGSLSAPFESSKHPQARLGVSPDGRYVAAGADDAGSIRIWDVVTGAVVAELTGHRGAVNNASSSRRTDWASSRGLTTARCGSGNCERDSTSARSGDGTFCPAIHMSLTHRLMDTRSRSIGTIGGGHDATFDCGSDVRRGAARRHGRCGPDGPDAPGAAAAGSSDGAAAAAADGLVPGDSVQFVATEFQFVPSDVIAEPGTYTGTLVNDGTIEHDIKIGDAEPVVAAPGETVEFEFTIPEGWCTVHLLHSRPRRRRRYRDDLDVGRLRRLREFRHRRPDHRHGDGGGRGCRSGCSPVRLSAIRAY